MRFILPTLFLAIVPGFSATIPLFFFPNTGQADSSVRYIVQTPDLSATFRAGGAIFHVQGHQLGVRFIGANPEVPINGLETTTAKVNFFLGTTAWKTDVPTYSKVLYRGLYPGIDMIYGANARQVKSEFLVAPHADPALIRLQYSEPVSLDAQGNLISGDLFREDAPEIYQQIDAQRVKIAGRYRLLDQYTVGFEVGPYNESIPLVIDPTISYCSYLGGTSTTAITGVALDSSANLYVTGWTQAVDFPTHGAYQAVNAGGVDVIVAKINAAGSGLLYASYIGGNGYDKGAAIAVDNLGQAYITGSTASSNFPLVSSNRATRGGSTTAFVLKLNAAGNLLLYSGYLGGTNWETGTAIAVDSSYNAYIAGDTQSSDFPTKKGTQTVIGGGMDAFITKLDPTGAYAFSTFLGGAGNEHAGGIAVDSLGDIFVAGGTSSANFPVLSPIQASLAGTQNAFVAKYSYLNAVAFSTYLGGAGSTMQQANAIALDPGGNPYIAGVTSSPTFPVTGTAFQTTLNGVESAFVTKMSSTGSAVVFSTYLGGDVSDWASAIAVSAAGNAYVAGWTSSVNFPQLGAVQAAFGGLTDAFVSEFNSTGNGLLFSTYYGGSQSDSINALALDSNANIFTGGQTASMDLPLLLPLESTTIASSTGWFLRLGGPAFAPTIPSPATGATRVTLTPTLSWGASIGATSYDVYFGTSPTPPLVANVTTTSYSPGTLAQGVTYYWQVAAKNANGSSLSAVWSFTTLTLPAAAAGLRDTAGAMRLSSYASAVLSSTGGYLASDPSIAQDSSGNTFLTARDTSNGVWANVYNAGSQTWGGWQFGGGVIQGVPSIAVAGSGTGWIASRDAYNSYWLLSYTPGTGFGAWIHLFGVFATNPVITACGDGSLYLLGKDNYNALWSGHYTPVSGFQGFVLGGGVVQGSPSVSCGNDNAAYISVRDNYNSSWVARVAGNTWTGWFNGGAVANIDTRIAALGGSLAIVILDVTGSVYRATFTEGTGNGWQAWTNVGGVLADIAPAGVGGELFFAGRTPGGTLVWWRQTGNLWTAIGNTGVAAGALASAPR